MNVVVLGASSQIGCFLLPLLTTEGFEVIAVSRRASTSRPSTNRSIRWIHTSAELDSDRQKVTTLVSCGPLGLAKDWVDALPELQRCIAFSSTSVHTKQTIEIAALRDSERQLQQTVANRAVALCLLRPTLIYGCGLDRNISQLYGFGKRWGRIPVSRRSEGLRQPCLLYTSDAADDL